MEMCMEIDELIYFSTATTTTTTKTIFATAIFIHRIILNFKHRLNIGFWAFDGVCLWPLYFAFCHTNFRIEFENFYA